MPFRNSNKTKQNNEKLGVTIWLLLIIFYYEKKGYNGGSWASIY